MSRSQQNSLTLLEAILVNRSQRHRNYLEVTVVRAPVGRFGHVTQSRVPKLERPRAARRSKKALFNIVVQTSVSIYLFKTRSLNSNETNKPIALMPGANQVAIDISEFEQGSLGIVSLESDATLFVLAH